MLIPREVLFGNPDKTQVKLSHDGNYLSYIAPVNGVLNVWVTPAGDPTAAVPVTDDTGRGVRFYLWAYSNTHILYIQDQDGDENWHLYITDVVSRDTRDLTPIDGITVRMNGISAKFPDEMLIGLNDRDPSLHDIYRVNLKTGERTLVIENEGFVGFETDDDFNVRFGAKVQPDGGIHMFQHDGGGTWTPFTEIAFEDTDTNTIGFDTSGDMLYWRDNRGRDTTAALAQNLETGEITVLATDDRADVDSVMRHPATLEIQAVAFNYERKTWTVIDDSIQPDLDALREIAEGDIEVTSRTHDDSQWIVAYAQDDGPVRYYQYARAAKSAMFLFTNRDELENYDLAKMHPVVIDARDGLKLVSYLTLPVGTDSDDDGVPDKPLPLVLDVHGGPWGRDVWGYNPTHQWLANRGYAVLSVNFRASTGFGKAFINAGNKQWGKAMHDDLIDAVEWAVECGVAQRDAVAIMGGSYGGYATLAGLTLTPEVFACGVDIVGPSNLLTLLETIPPYWKPMIAMMHNRMGDPETERDLLVQASPLTHVDNIQRPLLIGQGANDPRVKQAESDQIVEAMQAKNIPVTYVLYPDEGHGFARPENRLSFYGIAEAFLAANLEGEFEPLGDALDASTAQVLAGGDVLSELGS